MFALVVMGLLATITLASVGVLADSGLRWWSAFGMLRQELDGRVSPPLPSLRPVSGPDRQVMCGQHAGRHSARKMVTRAA